MPSPVPALPDTERISSHTISGVGPYNVNFDLYGDGVDYENWIEVYDDGVKLTVTTDWTLDSPSGTLSTLSRPITNARVTLVSAARTGTLKIVGARRPRRTTQFTEGVGVPARSFNQSITDIYATLREFFNAFGRVLRAPPGETLSLLSPAATRASRYLKTDASGNITHGQTVTELEAATATGAESAAQAEASHFRAAGMAAVAASERQRIGSAVADAQAAADLATGFLNTILGFVSQCAQYMRLARASRIAAAASATSASSDATIAQLAAQAGNFAAGTAMFGQRAKRDRVAAKASADAAAASAASVPATESLPLAMQIYS